MAGSLGTISGQVRLDVRQAVAAYALVRSQNQRTVYALRGTGDSMVAVGQKSMVAGGLLVYAFTRAVNAAAEFERKMDFFAAVTNTSSETMQELSKHTLQLAQDTIYSADQIAEGFIELGKAGVSAEQIMNGIGEAMANLGAAGDIPLAQSGQIITSTIQQYDLAAQDAVAVTDLLAGAANASIADITDIGVSLKYVGGVANAAGLTFEDTATAISLLAKAGIRGSTAGTSLRQMIVSLGGATQPARDALKEIGILTEDGTNKFFDQTGALKPLSQVYQLLNDHLDGYNQKERLAFLRTIFNNRALSAAAILTREGAKGFREMNAEMGKTTAADVAAERLDNLSGDIEILKGNIETVMIQAGTPFQEVMRGWVQGITKLVQAFGNLDPSTQKFIVQTIAITGVVLTVLGAISVFIGMVLRAAAAAKKLAAGLKFLWGILKLIRVIIWIIGLLVGGTFAAIAAAVIAVIAVFVLLYKNVKPFRDAINGLGQFFVDNVVKPIISAGAAVLKFFKLLVTDPKKAAAVIRGALGSAISWLGQQFGRLGDWISSGFDAAISAVGSFAGTVVQWFLSLPGRIFGALGKLADRLGQIFTFRNVGYAVGLAVGTIIRFFATLPLRLISLAMRAVTGLFGIFAQLAPRIGYFIGFMVGRAIMLFIRLQTMLWSLAGRTVMGIIRFFIRLPGRILSLIVQAGHFLLQGLTRMVAWAFANGPRIVAGIVNFLQNLPGRVWNLITAAVTSLWNAIPGAISAAVSFGQGVIDGIRDILSDLPGIVWDALNNAIGVFQDMVGQAFNAAQDFGAGLWDGFKDGLGIHSPSFIEKAMFALNDNVGRESRRLAHQTHGIQKLGKKMLSTRIGVTGMPETIATMQASKRMGDQIGRAPAQREARKEVAGKRRDDAKQTNMKMVSGSLAIDRSGRAFIKGVAIETVEENNQSTARHNRRRPGS